MWNQTILMTKTTMERIEVTSMSDGGMLQLFIYYFFKSRVQKLPERLYFLLNENQ